MTDVEQRNAKSLSERGVKRYQAQSIAFRIRAKGERLANERLLLVGSLPPIESTPALRELIIALHEGCALIAEDPS